MSTENKTEKFDKTRTSEATQLLGDIMSSGSSSVNFARLKGKYFDTDIDWDEKHIKMIDELFLSVFKKHTLEEKVEAFCIFNKTNLISDFLCLMYESDDEGFHSFINKLITDEKQLAKLISEISEPLDWIRPMREKNGKAPKMGLNVVKLLTATDRWELSNVCDDPITESEYLSFEAWLYLVEHDGVSESLETLVQQHLACNAYDYYKSRELSDSETRLFAETVARCLISGKIKPESLIDYDDECMLPSLLVTAFDDYPVLFDALDQVMKFNRFFFQVMFKRGLELSKRCTFFKDYFKSGKKFPAEIQTVLDRIYSR